MLRILAEIALDVELGFARIAELQSGVVNLQGEAWRFRSRAASQDPLHGSDAGWHLLCFR
jgi:hypothetical protein